METRSNVITFKGNPLTLVGPALAAGDDAPNATLVGNDLQPVVLSSFRGQRAIVSVVPSLDTPVCDVQTRRFNQEATALGDDVAVLTVSCDLPFAQARWCGAAGAERVVTLSDYRDGAFGKAWGLFIEELALLTRAVFVVDAAGKIAYAQIVPEVTDEPDYQAALDALRALA